MKFRDTRRRFRAINQSLSLSLFPLRTRYNDVPLTASSFSFHFETSSSSSSSSSPSFVISARVRKFFLSLVSRAYLFRMVVVVWCGGCNSNLKLLL